jgi:large subunit ribosomal protein L29
MTLSNYNEIKSLTLENIEKELLSLKTELLQLKIKRSTFKKIKPHLFKHIKHRISQLMFYKSELEIKK